MIHLRRIGFKYKFILPLLIMMMSIVPVNVFGVAKYDPDFFSNNDILFYNPTDIGCAVSGGTATQLSGADNREKIWNYLTASGLSPEQAAGIMGNIQSETAGTFSPTVNEGGKDSSGNTIVFPNGGYGIVQWTGGRRTNVVDTLNKEHSDLMNKYYNLDYSTDGKSYTSQAQGYVSKSASTGTLMPVADNDALLLTELNFMYQEATNRTINDAGISHSTGAVAGDTEWAAIMKQTTVEGASNIWVYSHERPAQIDTTAVARVANGNAIYAIYSTGATGAACATADTTIDQAHLYDTSVDISCAAGTVDAGIGQGFYRGKEVDIRLCSLPNTLEQAHNQPARVNSRVSGAFLALTNSLFKDSVSSPIRRGDKLLLSDSFRTWDEQVKTCKENPGVLCAAPGTSNHQMGLAIDFKLIWGYGKAKPVGDPIYDWLTANAGQYGIRQLSSEGWHWEPTGA